MRVTILNYGSRRRKGLLIREVICYLDPEKIVERKKGRGTDHVSDGISNTAADSRFELFVSIQIENRGHRGDIQKACHKDAVRNRIYRRVGVECESQPVEIQAER